MSEGTLMHLGVYCLGYPEFREVPDGSEFVFDRALCGAENRYVKVGDLVRGVGENVGGFRLGVGIFLGLEEHKKCPACLNHPDLPLMALKELDDEI